MSYIIPNYPNLREAAIDLRYLLNSGYNRKSALKLVGDRWNLNRKFRHILYRAIFSGEEIKARHYNEVGITEIRGKIVAIDTYNILITIESFLRGLQLIEADDGYYRDISKVFNKYKRSSYTNQAIQLVLNQLKSYQPKQVQFFLDKNISHSGDLAKIIEKQLQNFNINGEAQTVPCSDKSVIMNGEVIISSDRVVLERSIAHLNLIPLLLKNVKRDLNNVIKID